MKTIEEQIWDYIDGNGGSAQRSETARKIASEEEYQSVYRELLSLQQQFKDISIDEPSMSFSRNVMEIINMEPAPVSLKTKTDKRIILGLAALFILAIGTILAFAIANSHMSAPKFSVDINLSQYLSPTLIKTFVFADIVLAMLYADSLFRRKKMF
ncbi:MAG: hypothetical protein ABWY16_13960 [Pedobacter sp.]|jgi:hypothetical protein|uniref:hypothetical protein n=1 Tax=Pedobacter sp. TaxID=1411316 RepID=UPI003396005E